MILRVYIIHVSRQTNNRKIIYRHLCNNERNASLLFNRHVQSTVLLAEYFYKVSKLFISLESLICSKGMDSLLPNPIYIYYEFVCTYVECNAWAHRVEIEESSFV